MIKCTCINNKNKPQEIESGEWIEEGFEYHITHIFIQRNQNNIRGVHLREIRLTEKSKPYETYRIDRFAISINDLPRLIELANACQDLDGVDVGKLIEESELEIVK